MFLRKERHKKVKKKNKEKNSKLACNNFFVYAHKSGPKLLWSLREIFLKSVLVIALITPLYNLYFEKKNSTFASVYTAQAIKDSAFVMLSLTPDKRFFSIYLFI